MQTLKPGTRLQGGRYVIGRILGQGGFGITYLAEQDKLNRQVAIKEFYMKNFCGRDETTNGVTISSPDASEAIAKYRNKFLKEARNIALLKHPNIISVIDIFEENQTAYYVMEYVEGGSLSDLIKSKGPLRENEALTYIRQIGSALTYIHAARINHLDVKPANIMLSTREKRAYLIDFGVSKQYNPQTNRGTTTTPVGISRGYSPGEQYRISGLQEFSPQSDVYALAATLYKLLTGVTPPEPAEIEEDGLPLAPLHDHHVSGTTIAAIVAALRSRRTRTQSITAFIESLEGQTPADGEIHAEIISEVVKPEAPKPDTDTVSSSLKSLINNLQAAGNDREAYEACLKAVHEGNQDPWLQQKMAEIIGQMKKEQKKKDRRNILLAVILMIATFILTIMYYSF